MTGLRERKKADTRRALHDAAVRLAVEQGFDAVTREAIAEVAGVSLRTFTNYFNGKYEALAYRVTERMRTNLAVFRARPAEEPLWTAIIATLAGEDTADGGAPSGGLADPVEFAGGTAREEIVEVRRLLLDGRVRDAIPRELFAEWVTAIAERTGTDPERDTYPRLVAAVLRAVGDVVMETYARADPPVHYADLLRTTLADVAAGLPEPNQRTPR